MESRELPLLKGVTDFNSLILSNKVEELESLPSDAKIFILEYKLYLLLTNDHLHNEKMENIILQIKSLKKKIESIYQTLGNFNKHKDYFKSGTILERLESKCKAMLAMAYQEQNTVLRDVGIAIGSCAPTEVLIYLGRIWKEVCVENKNLVCLQDELDYKNVKFLLESTINISVSETCFKLASDIGPVVLILLLQHFRKHGGINSGYLQNLLENNMFLYLISHTIDVLYNENFLKNAIRLVCKMKYALNDIEFYAAIGDELSLKKELEGGQSQWKLDEALKQACFFGRENTVRILINKGADVNLGNGNLLYLAVKERKISIIKLLLDSKEINIGCKPEGAKTIIYEFAIQSDSEEIKALFKHKKTQINHDIIQNVAPRVRKRIQALRDQSWSFFGYNSTTKADDLEKALVNAIAYLHFIYTEDAFFNHALQGEKSILEILENPRLGLSKNTNSAQEVLGPSISKRI